MNPLSQRTVQGGLTWQVWATAGVILLVCDGARAIPAFVAASMQQEMGWSTASFFLPVSIGIALAACAAPMAAHAVERFGTGHILSAGLLILAAALALSASATSPLQLMFLWSVGIGIGGGLSAPVFGAIAAGRGHPAHCGTTSGVFGSTAVLGPALALPAVAALVESHGWRSGLYAGAFVACLAAWAALRMDGRTIQFANAPSLPLHPLRMWRVLNGRERRDLIAFAAIVAICGASTTGLVGTHLVSFCAATGGPLSMTAGVLIIMGLAGLIGGLGSGWLADRSSTVWLLAFYYGTRGMALLWLPHTSLSFVDLSRFSAFYGLDWAATLPALTVLMFRSFGRARIGGVMGWMMMAHHAGAAAAAALVGIAGVANYVVSFSVVGALCFLAAALVLLTKSGPKKAPARPARQAMAFGKPHERDHFERGWSGHACSGRRQDMREFKI